MTAAATGRTAIAKATRRIVPFLILIYFLNFLDRVNVGHAALTMNADLGLSATAFGLGSGLFFLGYCLFEVPSNLILHRVGARVWIGRIMVSWGVVSAATAFITDHTGFYLARILLGITEAGLFPGIILYLTYWFPAGERARITALFYVAVPLSQVLGAPLSTFILQYGDELLGWQSWRTMFLLEGLPSVIVGIWVFFFLTDRPAKAEWLSADERDWLVSKLAAEENENRTKERRSVLRAVVRPRVLVLGVVILGIAYGIYTLTFFLPQLIAGLAKGYGYAASLVDIGFLVAIPYALAALAMWWWARRSDRAGERILHTAVPMFLGAAGFVSLYFVDSPIAVMMAIVVAAVGAFATVPTFWTIPPTLLTGRALAAGIGLVGSFANVSGFAGLYLTGYLKDVTGDFKTGLLVAGGVMAAAGILTLTLLHRQRTAS
jgi:ACS family tartrate transporter-like MFS transporter